MTINPEEQIVARPGARASEPTAGPVTTSLPAAPAFAVPGWLSAPGRLVVDWARASSIRPASASGISVAITLCAAAWLTAGTRADSVRGVAALWAGYLAAVAARALASSALASSALASPAPSALSSSAQPRLDGSARAGLDEERLASASWLVAECAAYAGLVIGATADGWRGMWGIGYAVIALLAVRNLVDENSMSGPAGTQRFSLARWAARLVLGMPAGARVLLVSVVTPMLGPRAALLALLGWAFVATVLWIAARGWSAGDEPMTEPDGETPEVMRLAVLRLRDDGVLAERIGSLVKGNLLPLPPAVIGLTAICIFAFLGPRNLPGLLLVGPALTMLLAAAGSSSRHEGPFDWLVPAVLLGAQVVYIAAIGNAGRVPEPVSYVLCATLLLYYADLARGGPPARATAKHGIRPGWDGRLLLIGLAATVGLATFAYIALSAYLGVLVGASILTGYRGLREDGASDRVGSGRWR